MKKKLVIGFFSLIISILLGIFFFKLIMSINPSVTDEGHKFMPTKNIFLSIICSLISIPIVFLIISKIISNK